MGDAIQAAKAGILEIADIFVVNKADRDGADRTVREVRSMISLGAAGQPGGWIPPVCKTVASRNEGIDALVEALARHRAYLGESGELQRRRTARARREVESIAVAELLARAGDLRGRSLLDELAREVAAGRLDPYAAADRVVAGITG
jgi:LAO/AO transport system kinase